MKRRLFVAAALDEASRAACAAAAERLRAKGWPGRWVAPENYHLTVAFLGGVPEERIAEIDTALAGAAPRLFPVTVRLDTIGAFPTAQRPRIAWAGPGRAVPAFATLCGVVRSTLVALGFTFEGNADPHVTLARGDGRSPLPRLTPRPAEIVVDTLTLYESVTLPEGAQYQPLARFPIGGAAVGRRSAGKQPSA